MEPIEIYNRGRGPELKRIRITVYDVLHYLEGGWTAEQIAPVLSITVAEVEALTRYIEEHKEEVMAVHRRIEERIARGNPPEIEERLKGSHERLLARIEAIRRKQSEGTGNGASNTGGH